MRISLDRNDLNQKAMTIVTDFQELKQLLVNKARLFLESGQLTLDVRMMRFESFEYHDGSLFPIVML